MKFIEIIQSGSEQEVIVNLARIDSIRMGDQGKAYIDFADETRLFTMHTYGELLYAIKDTDPQTMLIIPGCKALLNPRSELE